MCNDHAADCQYNVSSMSALCINCTDNTMGDMCEQCLPQFYQDPTLLLDNPDICRGMSITGVVSLKYSLMLFYSVSRNTHL